MFPCTFAFWNSSQFRFLKNLRRPRVTTKFTKIPTKYENLAIIFFFKFRHRLKNVHPTNSIVYHPTHVSIIRNVVMALMIVRMASTKILSTVQFTMKVSSFNNFWNLHQSSKFGFWTLRSRFDELLNFPNYVNKKKTKLKNSNCKIYRWWKYTFARWWCRSIDNNPVDTSPNHPIRTRLRRIRRNWWWNDK